MAHCVCPEGRQTAEDTRSSRPRIFISYQLDVQSQVQELAQHLESYGYDCCTDMGPVGGQSGSRTGPPQGTLQGKRNINAAKVVVCCVTNKYIHSEVTKDLALADSLRKPILPVMLQWLSWPPEGHMHRILAPLKCIDMSNEKLFKRNLNTVVAHVKKNLGSASPRE